ncbi:MAG: CDF family Co(II)/Ni(II) efflux transporter DmeF [Porticoccus sp.]|nr:CDF family Co(II)/Ni(II) efflux transporter DmeF [Porticoccus sp.]
MQSQNTHHSQHDHTFAQDLKRPGESRTLIVIGITTVMMTVELIAGMLFGSMALLADGLHMASHAVALSITAFAYIYARRNARNSQYSFGTGKVNALGGFTGAVLLAIFALFMGIESIIRLLNPVEIVFNQAIFVAILGLLVNGVCVFILGVDDHGHDHHHGESESHSERENHHESEEHSHADHEHHDHNLKSAYLHVMADALTSVLAIIALLAAKYFGFIWMDPAMGIVGGILVARWSYSLLGSTSAVLLDRQASKHLQTQIRQLIETDQDTQITDLHVWSIGPKIYSAQITVVGHNPLPPNEYKALIPKSLGLVHVSIEIHAYSD